MGIEPTTKAWEALVLPLNYTRIGDSASHLGKLALPARRRRILPEKAIIHRAYAPRCCAQHLSTAARQARPHTPLKLIRIRHLQQIQTRIGPFDAGVGDVRIAQAQPMRPGQFHAYADERIELQPGAEFFAGEPSAADVAGAGAGFGVVTRVPPPAQHRGDGHLP